MAKRKIRLFISYAHSNKITAQRFVGMFKEYIASSKTYDYAFWQDVDLLAGENWDQRIQEELVKCDVGILLISAAFLNSKYIKEVELKTLFEHQKILIPVQLSKINFKRHDLLGLQEKQIFRLNDPAFSSPRSFEELRPKRRMDFIDTLFDELESRLDGK